MALAALKLSPRMHRRNRRRVRRTASGRSFVYNLRYPGQYYDSETSLNYNMARDYDPQTGRYVESDPIGLGSGVNTYSYVGGRPVDTTDSTGMLAFWHHFNITYDVSQECGSGNVASFLLAFRTMWVDFGTQGMDANSANIHAMIGTNPTRQSIVSASSAIANIEATAALPTALHTLQDAATPDHFMQPWSGFHFDLHTALHLWHDAFPTDATLQAARDNTVRKLGCGCGQ